MPPVERPVRTTYRKALNRLETSTQIVVKDNKFSYLYITAIVKLDPDSALEFTIVSIITYYIEDTYKPDLNKLDPKLIKEAYTCLDKPK